MRIDFKKTGNKGRNQYDQERRAGGNMKSRGMTDNGDLLLIGAKLGSGRGQPMRKGWYESHRLRHPSVIGLEQQDASLHQV